MTFDSLDTPALLLDSDAMMRNIARMAADARAAGIALRPHAKTHKSPAVARRQIAAGAVGVCCQKVGEAEIMVEGGVADVLVTNEIVGAAKLARLAEYPIVTFARGTKPQIALAELFAQRGLAPLRLHASAALSPAIKLALDGIAIALMPPAIVREELRAKRLMRIASDADLTALEFVACWPAAPGEPRAARVAELAAETAAATRSGA